MYAKFSTPPDTRYVCTSQRYSRYLNKILPLSTDGNTILFLFISGEAGIGKTTILENEFLRPLNDYTHVYKFRFLPNRHLKNYFFLKALIQDIFKVSEHTLGKKNKDQLEKNIPNKIVQDILYILSFDHNLKDSLFGISHNAILDKAIDVLLYASQTQEMTLVFEDIHLSNNNFKTFIKKLSKTSPSLPMIIVCTTRNKKEDFNVPLQNVEKWFNIHPLKKNDCLKISRKTSPDIIEDKRYINNVIDISGGNPYLLIQSLLSYKTNIRDKDGAIPVHEETDLTSSVLQSRFDSLNDTERKLLKAASIFGHEFSRPDLIKILDLDANTFKTCFQNLMNKRFFIFKNKSIYSFDHQIFYHFIQKNLTEEETTKYSLKAFRLLRSRQKEINKYDQLGRHAASAKLKAYAFHYYKELSFHLLSSGDYELAAYFCKSSINIYAQLISMKPHDKRLAQLYFTYLNALILSGQYKEAEQYILFFRKLAEGLAEIEKIEAISKISVIYWVLGKLEKATEIAEDCLNLSLEDKNSTFYITARDRLSLIQAERGNNAQALDLAFSNLNDIQNNKIVGKVSSYSLIEPSVQANISRILSEMGKYKKSLEYVDLSYSNEKKFDPFSYLYVTTLSGYSLYCLGEHDLLLTKLTKSLEIYETTRPTLIAPVFLSMYGICLSYLNQAQMGEIYINRAKTMIEELHQGHKTSMVGMFYLENLLLQFKVHNFEKLLKKEIEISINTNQKGFEGWIYLLNAIYLSCYKKSYKGFLGSIAKAGSIAEELEMKLLQKNISYLLDKFQPHLFDHKTFSQEESTEDQPPFLKAEYFYNLTHNISSLRVA